MLHQINSAVITNL